MICCTVSVSHRSNPRKTCGTWFRLYGCRPARARSYLVQITNTYLPWKNYVSVLDHGDYTAPNRQHKLHHTWCRSKIYPPWKIYSISRSVWWVRVNIYLSGVSSPVLWRRCGGSREEPVVPLFGTGDSERRLARQGSPSCSRNKRRHRERSQGVSWIVDGSINIVIIIVISISIITSIIIIITIIISIIINVKQRGFGASKKGRPPTILAHHGDIHTSNGSRSTLHHLDPMHAAMICLAKIFYHTDPNRQKRAQDPCHTDPTRRTLSTSCRSYKKPTRYIMKRTFFCMV